MLSITDWHGTTAPEDGDTAEGESTSAEVGQTGPSWGAEDTLFIAIVTADSRSVSGSYDAAPTNYTNLSSQWTPGAADGATLGTARRENNTASEDPDNFTISDSTFWITRVVAIRPAAAGGPPQTGLVRVEFS